jgi:hypothetical protein
MLLLLGGAISGPLALVVLFVAGGLVGALTDGMDLQGTEKGLLTFLVWGLLVLVALLPALLLGWLAARMPRALHLKCRRCGWSETYLLPSRQRPARGARDAP